MKSLVETDDSCTQEASPLPESSSSSSNQDLHEEFRTRSGRHIEAVERYGCPIDDSEKVSIVEIFSFEENPNSFQEVEKSESTDDRLAAMTKSSIL